MVPLVSGSQSFLVCHREVLGPLLLIRYTSEMFELVENRLYASADDSTLLVVVHKPGDRPAVAASLNMGLARIQKWCNHWCMLLNLNKTMALVVGRFRAVNPPHGDLVLCGVSICASPNLDILGVKFDSRLTLNHLRGIVFSVSQTIGILGLVKHVFVDTSVFLRCYYTFVISILEYCSLVWGSAAECHLQLLERQVYSVARLCPDKTFLSLCHRCHVAALCMFYNVNSNSDYCSVSFHLLLSEFNIPELRLQLIY